MIRIGNASGYWGDDPEALARQVNGGKLDYISMDFLAEITMSIMQKQKSRDPDLGYARDFLPMLEGVLAKIVADGTKIITNAGGINPEACADAITKLALKLGVKVKVAVVYGDDILPDLALLRAKGCQFRNMETDGSFDGIDHKVQAANIYFGAAPVAKALAWEPDIIVTGRVTDTGITIGPMLHDLGWKLTDFNKLAAGVVAGHIIECGSQSTGGNFTDWHLVKSYKNMGYPIIEMHDDGTFFVTKHPGTGGLVTVDTVREQLFYEMGTPKGYITPDVVADFSTINLKADGENRVKVTNIKGFEPTPLYKVSMAYADGYKCLGEIAISGPNAKEKAEAFAHLFWERAGRDFAKTETELYGLNACHRTLGHAQQAEEIILRLGARDQDQKKLKRFAKIIPSVILGGPPGVFVLGGAPKVTEIVSYWPALMPKSAVNPKVALYNNGLSDIQEVTDTLSGNFVPEHEECQVANQAKTSLAEVKRSTSKGTPLSAICLARSGDKGDTANIGVMARSEKAFEFLDHYLAAERVKDGFQELCLGSVRHYKLKNMLGFNFLLENSLGGGGTMTLRADAQGKTFAQAVLRQKVEIPQHILDDMHSSGANP